MSKRIKELPEQEKPYEKCQMLGAEALTDAELLAVLIRTGTEGTSSVELAHQILDLNGRGETLQNLYHASSQELMNIRGIGKVKSIQIICLCELEKRLARGALGERLIFKKAGSVADYYMEEMRHLEQEQLRCVFLNTKCHLICDRIITKGTVNMSLISPREIFVEALRCGAVQMILLHNHPSGDPTPSHSDIEVTKKVLKAGALLGISLSDHIIIGDRCYFSLKERGYIT